LNKPRIPEARHIFLVQSIELLYIRLSLVASVCTCNFTLINSMGDITNAAATLFGRLVRIREIFASQRSYASS